MSSPLSGLTLVQKIAYCAIIWHQMTIYVDTYVYTLMLVKVILEFAQIHSQKIESECPSKQQKGGLWLRGYISRAEKRLEKE